MSKLCPADFDKRYPHVPKDIGTDCAILFKLSGCHWCGEMQQVWDKLNKTIGFMSLYTFCVDENTENMQHWEKIKKRLKNSDQLDGFPIVMLYSLSGRVVVYPGFQEYDEMKNKMIKFSKN